MNVLGANIARHCLELGKLDEVLAIVAPVLLGRRSGIARRRDSRCGLQTQARRGLGMPTREGRRQP